MKNNNREYKLSVTQYQNLESVLYDLETKANLCRAMFYLFDSPEEMVGTNEDAFRSALDISICFLIDSVRDVSLFYDAFIHGKEFEISDV